MVSLAGVEGSLVRVDCLVPIGVGVTGMCGREERIGDSFGLGRERERLG